METATDCIWLFSVLCGLSASLLPYILLLVVISLDVYNWYPQQTDSVIIEKEIQVCLINCVVILLVETHVPYDFALSEVHFWPGAEYLLCSQEWDILKLA